MARRGVLYMVWGDKIAPYLERATASVRKWHPELPIHVERLPDGLDPVETLLRKAQMLDVSPFEETVFLDADTVVLGRLDFGFDRAQKFKLACTINGCPWARRYGDPALAGDMIEYSTGVLFFTRAAKPVFDAWAACVDKVDSSIEWVENDGRPGRTPYADQAGFSKAIEDLGFSPFVLPINWNYSAWWHRAFYGPIRIWHDYSEVPEFVIRENQTYLDPNTKIRFYPIKVSPTDPQFPAKK
jgi:hypothetical protein